MLRIIMRGLLARKFRLFATALAVTLGVAFMAGTLVLTDTIGKTFNDLSSGVYKGTDAEVRAKAAFTGGMYIGAQRPLRRRLACPHPRPGARRRPGRRQHLRVHQAHRQERAGTRQPGPGCAHAGRQLEPGGCAQPLPPPGGPRTAGPRAGRDRRQERARRSSGDRGHHHGAGERPAATRPCRGHRRIRHRGQPGRRIRGAVHHPGRATAGRRARQVHQHSVRRQAGRLPAATGQQPPGRAPARA